MNFSSLIAVEFKKIKRSRILPVLFIAALILWLPSLFSAQLNFDMAVGITPEHNFFIQGLLGLSWFLYPASMVVATLLLNQIERSNNGILKMLALPINMVKLSLAKFVVLLALAAVQLLMVAVIYYISAAIISQTQDYNFILSPLFVLREMGLIYVSSIPMLAVFWMISVCIHTPIFAVGLSLASIVPSVLFINTKAWFLYPMCYPFFVITSEYGKLSTDLSTKAIEFFPWIPVAVIITTVALSIASARFGKVEGR